MPLCGFNEKMLEGNKMFEEGLVEHGLEYRSKKNKETMDQAIKREISDMTRFLLELDRIEDRSKRMLTEGIIKYAMGFYLIIREKGTGEYKKVIEKINEYFFEMDRKYYGELEGEIKDMEILTNLLNKIEI